MRAAKHAHTGLLCPRCRQSVEVIENQLPRTRVFRCPACGHRWSAGNRARRSTEGDGCTVVSPLCRGIESVCDLGCQDGQSRCGPATKTQAMRVIPRACSSLFVVLFVTWGCVQRQSETERGMEFRMKVECSIAAERYDRVLNIGITDAERASYLQEPWVNEVFYSPSRNTCICHVSFHKKDAGLSEFLQDCLTRETLATHLTSVPNAAEQEELFRQTDRELRAPLSGGSQ